MRSEDAVNGVGKQSGVGERGSSEGGEGWGLRVGRLCTRTKIENFSRGKLHVRGVARESGSIGMSE